MRASQVAPERAFTVLDSDGSDLKDFSKCFSFGEGDGVVAAQDMLGLLHYLGLPLTQDRAKHHIETVLYID